MSVTSSALIPISITNRVASSPTRGSPDAYCKLLTGIGTKVANASTEGSFLGLGGERISDGEQKFLARLESVVAGKA